ncbi:hypothetical protein CMI45_02595 [Candidatus Pacearchaeota archaeon]|nr:hypothetical protein [Candidatus Pacearchaeota archaeon]|tara:strand:+ start:2261 stop:2455 length:195 start_codon:yes stop_codon:yes gene_type:complete
MSDEVDPQRAFRQAERYFGYKGPDVLMREGRDYPKIHPGVSAFNREMKKKAGLHKKGRNLPVGF